jgi:microcin C transport system substrate-binding protein
LIIRKLAAFVFLSICLLISKAQAEPKHAITLYGDPPRYDKEFKHFDHVNPKAPKGGSLILSGTGTFDSLNPFIIKGTPAAGMSVIYPSLFYVCLMQHSFDEPSVEYGYAAETVDFADDKLSITYKLRAGITFHDGSPITADDVIFSFNTLVAKGTPLYRNYYADVKQVTKLDDRTIKFEFKHNKNKELPIILGQFPIFSKKYYEKHTFDKSDLAVPLGNGPYKILTVDPGRSITYERVKNWWGENLPINVGRYNFDRIQYKYFRDFDIAFEAFKSGEYDFRHENKISNWVKGYDFPAAKEGRVIKLEVPERQVGIMQALVINTRRDQFKDKRVREALNEAFDFEWVNKNLFYGQYKRCDSYFAGTELAAHSDMSAAEKQILEPFKSKLTEEIFSKSFILPSTDGSGNDRQNLKKAAKLLTQAGWIVKDGVLVNEKTKKPFEFEILLVQADLVRTIQPFVNNLKHLGITAKIRIVDGSQYLRRVNEFDFDMISAVLPQSVSPGNEQREFWSTKVADINGSRNYAGIKDPVVDALIERVIDASSRQELVDNVHALDRVLMWGYYVVPMWYSSILRLAFWDKLEHPKTFPKYQFDIEAFWDKNATSKK